MFGVLLRVVGFGLFLEEMSARIVVVVLFALDCSVVFILCSSFASG